VDQGTRALKDLAEKQKPRDNNAGGQGTRNGRARGASPGTARNAEAANTTANASEGTGNQQASGQRGQGVQRRPLTADEQAKYVKGECFLCGSTDHVKYNCPQNPRSRGGLNAVATAPAVTASSDTGKESA
jgi:hypothetical protein